MIIFPGELNPPERGLPLAYSIAQTNVQGAGMISLILDVNNEKKIVINDGTNDVIGIGYFET